MFVIIFGSLSSRAWAFQRDGIDISYFYIGIYCSLLVLGGIMLMVIPDVVSVMGDVAAGIVGMLGMLIVFN